MGKKRYLFFIAVIWIVLMIPLIGMIWYPTKTSPEKQELAQWPVVNMDNWWDLGNLEKMSAYFEDHFSLRREMLTANAFIRSGLLRSETTDQVIVGKHEWLYFGGDLSDFQGTELLSERELTNIIHNITLMKNYIEQQGSQLILTIAPNKSTLYGENMPYYYMDGESRNLQQLTKLLAAAEVNYVDLHSLFQEQDEILYFKKDSHWNTKGAVLVYNALMEALGIEHETYGNIPYSRTESQAGDLEEMLYPAAVSKEEDISYEYERSYEYVNEVTDHMDAWIETRNPDKGTAVLMYRDSFGEKLVPLIAEEVGTGYFSRLVPYNLAQVAQYRPDYVVIERVERKIAAFATEAPVMQGPVVENIAAEETVTNTTIDTSMNGAYLVLEGKIDEAYLDNGTAIYIAVTDSQNGSTKTYQPFYLLTKTGNGNGYQLYLAPQSVPEEDYQIRVITVNNGQAYCVASISQEQSKGEKTK